MKGKRRALPVWQRSTPFKRVAIAQFYRGQLHWQKWPRKRGRTQNPRLKQIQQRFAAAQQLAKYVDDQARWMAEAIATGGPVYPRDLHISAMYGRLFEVLRTNEGTFYSVALRDDISHDLDIVAGKEPGTLLVRGANVWNALLPGPVDQVLASNGPGTEPTYKPLTATNAIIYTAMPCSNIISTTNFNCKGSLFIPIRPYTHHHVTIRINTLATFDWQASLLEVDGSLTVTQVLGRTTPLTIPNGLNVHQELTFPSPPTTTSYKLYVICVHVINAPPTYQHQNFFQTSAAAWLNMQMFHGLIGSQDVVPVELAQALPNIGHTFTNLAGATHWNGLHISG